MKNVNVNFEHMNFEHMDDDALMNKINEYNDALQYVYDDIDTGASPFDAKNFNDIASNLMQCIIELQRRNMNDFYDDTCDI